MIVMAGILCKLDKSKVKVVAYTEDLVILVMSEIIEGALGKVYLWAARSGLGINPIKTELMLCGIKTRVPDFHLS